MCAWVGVDGSTLLWLLPIGFVVLLILVAVAKGLRGNLPIPNNSSTDHFYSFHEDN